MTGGLFQFFQKRLGDFAELFLVKTSWILFAHYVAQKPILTVIVVGIERDKVDLFKTLPTGEGAVLIAHGEDAQEGASSTFRIKFPALNQI